MDSLMDQYLDTHLDTHLDMCLLVAAFWVAQAEFSGHSYQPE